MTDVRQAARNLLQRNAELSLVNRINGVLVSSFDVEQIQKTVLREVVQMLQVSEASIWLADGPLNGLRCAQSLSQTGEPLPEAALTMWSEVAQRVVRTGQGLASSQGLSSNQARASEQAGIDDWLSNQFTNGNPFATFSFVCVPLQLRETVLGVLLFVYHGPKHVRAVDVHIVESIAAATAAALDNADLYRKAQELAIVQERQRLAVTLHEAINQSLFSAGLITEVLPRLIELDPAQANISIQDLRMLLRGAVEDLREVLIELQPAMIGHANFGDLLRGMASSYSGRTATTVAVNISGHLTFPAPIQEALYHIAREVFSNIAKHAEATQVWVELTRKHGDAALIIRDNGRGFDSNHIPAGHYGLAMMQQQAAHSGAHLQIVSQIGQGTEIMIVIPDVSA